MQAVKELLQSLDIPSRIGQLGIDRDKFEREVGSMVELALQDRCTPTNPQQPSREDLMNIYHKAF
ncbi:hypothetical protein N752_12080 [Desulforamulus aquiferis]|nr:iron-containing alcohol dehydrogenase [Desulforamulus aquiferis]RYD04918.1 hypothetical protein N752_12080 [Desulforamulus aquiferis]